MRIFSLLYALGNCASKENDSIPGPAARPHLLQRLPVGGELLRAAGRARRHLRALRRGRLRGAPPEFLLLLALPGARPRRPGLRGAPFCHEGTGNGNRREWRPPFPQRLAAAARRGTWPRAAVPGVGAGSALAAPGGCGSARR